MLLHVYKGCVTDRKVKSVNNSNILMKVMLTIALSFQWTTETTKLESSGVVTAKIRCQIRVEYVMFLLCCMHVRKPGPRGFARKSPVASSFLQSRCATKRTTAMIIITRMMAAARRPTMKTSNDKRLMITLSTALLTKIKSKGEKEKIGSLTL